MRVITKNNIGEEVEIKILYGTYESYYRGSIQSITIMKSGVYYDVACNSKVYHRVESKKVKKLNTNAVDKL